MIGAKEDNPTLDEMRRFVEYWWFQKEFFTRFPGSEDMHELEGKYTIQELRLYYENNVPMFGIKCKPVKNE